MIFSQECGTFPIAQKKSYKPVGFTIVNEILNCIQSGILYG